MSGMISAIIPARPSAQASFWEASSFAWVSITVRRASLVVAMMVIAFSLVHGITAKGCATDDALAGAAKIIGWGVRRFDASYDCEMPPELFHDFFVLDAI